MLLPCYRLVKILQIQNLEKLQKVNAICSACKGQPLYLPAIFNVIFSGDGRFLPQLCESKMF